MSESPGSKPLSIRAGVVSVRDPPRAEALRRQRAEALFELLAWARWPAPPGRPGQPGHRRPADPETARLLGWTELGPGTADRGTVTTGQLHLPDTAPPGTRGPVRIFYRPEDLLLGTPLAGTQAAASLTAPAAQILPTRPLARITLAADPPLTALLLHRDLQSLRP